MHYTPNGKVALDRSRLGLVLAPEPPELLAESRNFWNVDIAIPPFAPEVTFEKEFPIHHDVLLRARSTEDVLHGHASHHQRVCDQETVAAPRHRLGTHQGEALPTRPLQQFFEPPLELRRQHVVGIPLKGGVPPAGVR